MRTDRVRREMQRRADLGIRATLGEHPQHLALAFGEPLAYVDAPAGRKCGGENGVDIEAARRNSVDRPCEILERRVLQRETTRSGVERLGDKALIGDA